MSVEPESRVAAFNVLFGGVNKDAVFKERDLMEKIPLSVTPSREQTQLTRVSQSPLILIGNGWSMAARTLAAERERRALADKFVEESASKRLWLVEDVAGKTGYEIRQLAHLLPDRLVEDLIYHGKVELGLPWFVFAGLRSNMRGFGGISVTIPWAEQEERHGRGIFIGLEIAGKIDQMRILEVEAEMRDNEWKSSDHNGFDDSPEAYEAFGGPQEWVTARNYRKLRKDIRRAYGIEIEKGMSPEQRAAIRDVIAIEKKRKYEVGFSEYMTLIIKDETVHCDTYTELQRISAKYFPDMIYDIIAKVRRRFTMPYTGKIEGGEGVAMSLYPTEEENLFESSKEISRFNGQTFDRMAREMGVADLDTLKVASNNIKALQARNPVDEMLEAYVIKVSPDGTLEPYDNLSEIVAALRQAA